MTENKRTIGTGPIGKAAQHRLRALQALAGAPGFAGSDNDPAWYLTTTAIESVAAGDVPDSIRARIAELVFSFREKPLLLRTDRGDVFGGVPPTLAAAADDTVAVQPLLDAIRDCVRRSGDPCPMMVMPVPGRVHGKYFFPDISALACTQNPYVWNEYMSADGGVVRIVCGLSTRFNDRSGNDYSRIVALDAPERRPETNTDQVARYSQRKLDCLDMETGEIENLYLSDILADMPEFPADLLLTDDARPSPLTGKPGKILTLDPLLKRSPLLENIEEWMKRIRDALGTDIRAELSTQATPDGSAPVQLVACRPMRVVEAEVPDGAKALFSAQGAVMGYSREAKIDRIVYVSPKGYSGMPVNRRSEVARAIGRINKACKDMGLLLLGPGRWATSSAELGIPVSFTEIGNATVIGEIAEMHDTLKPEISYGSHIFNELVAMNILYLAISPGKAHNDFDDTVFSDARNLLTELVPGVEDLADIVRVIDAETLAGAGQTVTLKADTRAQRAVAYIN